MLDVSPNEVTTSHTSILGSASAVSLVIDSNPNESRGNAKKMDERDEKGVRFHEEIHHVRIPDRNFVPIKSSQEAITSSLGLQSSAISTIKANLALREVETLRYLRKFSTSPYAAKSAKYHKQNTVHIGTSTNASKFPSIQVLTTGNGVISKAGHNRSKSREALPPVPAGLKPITEFSCAGSSTIFCDQPDGWPLHPTYMKHNQRESNSSKVLVSPTKRLDSYVAARKKSVQVPTQTEEIDPELKSNSPDPNIKNMRDQLTLAKEEILADEHLIKLADKLCAASQAIESLDSLIDISAGNDIIAQDSLFDRGGVAIVLHILQKFPEDVDIQAKACRLLDIMGRANPLTFKALYRQKGFIHIFAAMQRIYEYSFESKLPTHPSDQTRTEKASENNSPATIDLHQSISPVEKQKSAEDAFREIVSSKFNKNVIERVEPLSKGLVRKCCMLLKEINSILESKTTLITTTLDHETLLHETAAKLQDMVSCEKGFIYLIDQATGNLYVGDYDPALDRLEKSMIREKHFFPDQSGFAGSCSQIKRVINVQENAFSSSIFCREIDSRGLDTKVSSVLCVPMFSDTGGVCGVIECINKMDSDRNIHAFDAADEFLVQHVAHRLMNLAHQVNLSEQLHSLGEQYKIIIEAGSSLTGASAVDKMTYSFITNAKDIMLADRCGLFLHDTVNDELTSVMQFNEVTKKLQLPANKGLVGYTFQKGEMLNVADASIDPRFNGEIDHETGYNTHSVLSAPLKTMDGQGFGVLQMLNKQTGRFTSSDEHLIRFFASQVTSVLDKGHLMQQKTNLTQMLYDARNYANRILSSVENILLSIDSNDRVRDLNHPHFFALQDQVDTFRGVKYEVLFGFENEEIISDIRGVLESGGSCRKVKSDLKVAGKVKTVNYDVSCLEEVFIPTGETVRLVVVAIEDISLTTRALETLGRYITKELANQVMADEGVSLKSSRVKVSALYINTRQYMSLCEKLDAEKYTSWMSQHFSVIMNDIASENGTLDKFMHGQLTAIFGEPTVLDENPMHACECALRVKSSFGSLNSMLEEFGRPPVEVSIGINTGEILSAFIGTTSRSEIMRTGDAITLAKRMEAFTQTYNVDIIVTEFTQKEVCCTFFSNRKVNPMLFRWARTSTSVSWI
ncbi:GAF domain-like protein, partial [Chytriomyces sp. MP71]